MLFNLNSPTIDLSVFDSLDRTALQKAGFTTVRHLLTHYPTRYEDRRRFDAFPQEASDVALCLRGEVTDVKVKRFGARKSFVEVTVRDIDDSNWNRSLTLRFFSMPFIAKSFPVEERVVLYGKVKASGNRLVMDHPEFESIPDDADEMLIHLERLVPIYSNREGIPQRTIRRLIHKLLQHITADAIPDMLRKPSQRGAFAGLTRYHALQQIHFPNSETELDRSRRYLALEEFFVLQLNVMSRKHTWDQLRSDPRCGPGLLLKQWLDSMSFSLTGAQQRAIHEIRADLAAPRPMHRLLQGDVGSGKTFVAMAAMLLAVESGVQAALMAPTVILAEQHYANFRKWLDPLGLRIGLRTGNRKEDGDDDLFSTGPPQLIIGTHALISENSRFEKLGLVVIDEQHKFGVSQRSKLIQQGTAPDVLAMTATPIPRTLTMTVYGDLDVSVLDEMPAGRGRIHTAVREQPDQKQVAAFLRQQIDAGRQAYLVYPLVETSESLKLKAATQEFEKWSQILAPIPLGLVHGRMTGEQKSAVMNDFRDAKLKVLISTTVIEVGVDVPNASVMIVFEAERFGIAQLHQLRGRIGRGQHRSWCVLVASGTNPEATRRLKVLEKTTDGFAVAEEDLKLRGPGDLLGTSQSGLPGLQLGDLIRDAELVTLAKKLAVEAITADPTLKTFQSLLFDAQTNSTLS